MRWRWCSPTALNSPRAETEVPTSTPLHPADPPTSPASSPSAIEFSPPGILLWNYHFIDEMKLKGKNYSSILQCGFWGGNMACCWIWKNNVHYQAKNRSTAYENAEEIRWDEICVSDIGAKTYWEMQFFHSHKLKLFSGKTDYTGELTEKEILRFERNSGVVSSRVREIQVSGIHYPISFPTILIYVVLMCNFYGCRCKTTWERKSRRSGERESYAKDSSFTSEELQQWIHLLWVITTHAVFFLQERKVWRGFGEVWVRIRVKTRTIWGFSSKLQRCLLLLKAWSGSDAAMVPSCWFSIPLPAD